jgi:hypothetical protein
MRPCPVPESAIHSQKPGRVVRFQARAEVGSHPRRSCDSNLPAKPLETPSARHNSPTSAVCSSCSGFCLVQPTSQSPRWNSSNAASRLKWCTAVATGYLATARGLGSALWRDCNRLRTGCRRTSLFPSASIALRNLQSRTRIKTPCSMV